MLTIAQWIVWGIAACFTVSGLYYFWLRHVAGRGVFGGTIGTATAQFIMVLWTLFEPAINKFHLLWLFPLSYPVGIVLGTFFIPLGLPKSFPIYATVGIYIAVLYFLMP